MAPATEDPIHIGTSGWSYKDWDRSFYPRGCAQAGRLAHYASRFSCVEVDSTFYGVPKKETVRAWAERTPGRFRFPLKVPEAELLLLFQRNGADSVSHTPWELENRKQKYHILNTYNHNGNQKIGAVYATIFCNELFV